MSNSEEAFRLTTAQQSANGASSFTSMSAKLKKTTTTNDQSRMSATSKNILTQTLRANMNIFQQREHVSPKRFSFQLRDYGPTALTLIEDYLIISARMSVHNLQRQRSKSDSGREL